MTLAALIRKRGGSEAANAKPAKPANDGQGKVGSLARLATLALANSTSPDVAPLRDPAAEARRQRVLTAVTGQAIPSPVAEIETRHWRWNLHFADGRVVEHRVLPEPTALEMRALHPDAVRLEPLPEAVH